MPAWIHNAAGLLRRRHRDLVRARPAAPGRSAWTLASSSSSWPRASKSSTPWLRRGELTDVKTLSDCCGCSAGACGAWPLRLAAKPATHRRHEGARSALRQRPRLRGLVRLRRTSSCDQNGRGAIECPLCADRVITRLPSAPRLNLSGARVRRPAGDAGQTSVAPAAGRSAGRLAGRGACRDGRAPRTSANASPRRRGASTTARPSTRGIRGQATPEQRECAARRGHRDRRAADAGRAEGTAAVGPEGRAPAPARVTLQHAPGVEQALRVQRLLDARASAPAPPATCARPSRALQRADAVLGRERAAVRRHRVVDDAVDRVLVLAQEGRPRRSPAGACTL